MSATQHQGTDRRGRLVAALLVVGTLGAIGTWMTYASFSATTANPGNRVTAGTVVIADDAIGATLYDESDRIPGERIERCIQVAYGGSLPADLRLYATPVLNGEQLRLNITHGQGATSFPSCAGFTGASGGPALYSGTLASFTTEHDSWSTGLVLPPPSAAGWESGTERVLRFELEQTGDDPFETGPHTYVWEARNR